MKKTFFGTVLSLAFFALAFQAAFAMESVAVAELEGLPAFPEVTEGVDIGNLESRVLVLNQVLDFTEEEVISLMGKLRELKKADGDSFLFDLYEYFEDHGAVALTTIADYREDVAELNSVDQARDLALDIRVWRSSTYDVRNKMLVNFLLLGRSESAIAITEARSEKIDRDIARLQDAFGEAGAVRLQTLFTRALLEIEQARAEQSSARVLFRSYMIAPEGQTAVEAALMSSEDEALYQEALTGALSHVGQAYRYFIEMSRLANDLLQSN